MTQYDFKKIEWCNNYIAQLRKLILVKYDSISAFTLTYIENYWQYTEEEKEKIRENAGANRKVDLNQKPFIDLRA